MDSSALINTTCTLVLELRSHHRMRTIGTYSARALCVAVLVLTRCYAQPKRLAIGIFEEMRSLPDNLHSFKKYIVEPFEENGVKVDIYIVLAVPHIRIADEHEMQESLNEALKITGLERNVVHREEYNVVPKRVGFMEKFIGIVNSAHNSVGNPVIPLFYQYKARDRVGRAILAHIEEYEQSDVLVMYLRSDVVFYFPECELNSSSNPNASKTLWDNVQPYMHLLSTPISIGNNVEGWGGWHDRWHLLSQSAFMNYASHLWKNFESLLRNGHKIGGEEMHMNLTLQATNLIPFKPIIACYGVRRAHFREQACKWNDYGDLGCKDLDLPSVRLIFNEKNFLPGNRTLNVCKSNVEFPEL